jgi:hypothetical protein
MQTAAIFIVGVLVGAGAVLGIAWRTIREEADKQLESTAPIEAGHAQVAPEARSKI